jgi:hypothetical protein
MNLLLDRDAVNLGDNWLEIERVYALDWQKFETQDWQILHEIYQSLPHFLGYNHLPFWFGKSAHTLPHLWASVEVAGLRVAGILPIQDWLIWESIFQEKLYQLQNLKTAK